jgi:hemerythrin superfamily protein
LPRAISILPQGATDLEKERPMNAIQMLKDQHREVEELFSKLEQSPDDTDIEVIFERIADALTLHTALEERHFYPMAQAADANLVERSLEDHAQVKALLGRLQALDVADDDFEEKLQALKQMVEDHVEEEENTLFPEVERVCGAEQLNAVGQAMTQMVQELELRTPRVDVTRELEAERREAEAGAPLE